MVDSELRSRSEKCRTSPSERSSIGEKEAERMVSEWMMAEMAPALDFTSAHTSQGSIIVSVV